MVLFGEPTKPTEDLGLPPEVVAFLIDGTRRIEVELPAPYKDWHFVAGLATEDTVAFVRGIWQRARPALLVRFVAQRPGTRPFAWWAFDAPEPRRKLGGSGQTWSELGCYKPEFVFGIEELDPRTINRRDLPRYESQPAYLKRLGLLVPGEERRLARSAFNPETR